MAAAERDWWAAPGSPSRADRVGQVVRLVGAEPALTWDEAAHEAGSNGWWRHDVAAEVTEEDRALAGAILELEQDLRARQLAALWVASWLEARFGSDPETWPLAPLVEWARAALVLGWLDASPEDPVPALLEEWAPVVAERRARLNGLVEEQERLERVLAPRRRRWVRRILRRRRT